MSQGFKIKMQKPKDGTYSLGQLIHVKMKAKGWTVDEFAAQISFAIGEDVGTARVYRIFEDKVTLPLKHLCVILDLVDVSDAEFGQCRRAITYSTEASQIQKEKAEERKEQSEKVNKPPS